MYNNKKSMNQVSHTVWKTRGRQYFGYIREIRAFPEYSAFNKRDARYYNFVELSYRFETRVASGWKDNSGQHYSKQWQRGEYREYKKLKKNEFISFGDVIQEEQPAYTADDIDELLLQDFTEMVTQ